MFPKKNRADKSAIALIFTKGKFINSPHLTLKFVLNTGYAYPRISFIVPKTTSKGAVERNLLRRRGYSVLSQFLPTFPAGFLGVFIFNKKSMEYFGAKSANKTKNKESIQNLENEIKSILHKIN